MDESIVEKVKALNLSDGVHEKIEVDGKLATVSKVGCSLVIGNSDSIILLVSDSIILN